jgi:hypothetical protein
MPPTISVVCEILYDSEQGCSCFIKVVSGMSAAVLLGRFCHLDEQIMNNTLTIRVSKKSKIRKGSITTTIRVKRG